MATAAENIQTAIDSLSATIALNAGKLSYSIDGQSVSHDQAVTKLNSLIQTLAMLQGPAEVESYGVV